MFKNYYYLLGISPKSTEDEINAALERLKGKRSQSLLEEIRMILLNKGLRGLYDSEFELYSNSADKNDYIIKNAELERELEKIRAYQENKAELSNQEFFKEEEKRNSFKRSIRLHIIGIIVLSLVKCAASCFNRSLYYY